jgi:hypothetical protein
VSIDALWRRTGAAPGPRARRPRAAGPIGAAAVPGSGAAASVRPGGGCCGVAMRARGLPAAAGEGRGVATAAAPPALHRRSGAGALMARRQPGAWQAGGIGRLQRGSARVLRRRLRRPRAALGHASNFSPRGPASRLQASSGSGSRAARQPQLPLAGARP